MSVDNYFEGGRQMKKMSKSVSIKRAAAALLGGVAAVASLSVAAQDYPSRSIRLVVPFPPGGTTDIVARLVADKVGARQGRPLVVENRPGAGGAIGAEAVARSAPDGYTLVVSNIASNGSGPALRAAMPYDPDRSFAHIALLGTVANALVVHPDFPAKTVQEFIAHAKARPPVMFGSGGVGTSAHLAGELLKVMAGIDLQHVPYKGAAPAMADLLGKQIPAVFDGLPAVLAQVKAGKLRIIAVTSPARSPAAPDAQTFAEGGVQGYQATSWFGISGPAGLPTPVVDRLASDIGAVLKLPEVAQRLTDLGFAPGNMTPAEYQGFVRTELAKWADVVKRAGIPVQ
jgi:tripartite-type tricarboxylate transporter receptor subunit TctC